jgi:hypothetical protein
MLGMTARMTVGKRLAAIEARASRLVPAPEQPVLRMVREDPAALLTAAGMPPDPWQLDLLRSDAARLLLLCSRQAGKSTVAAALAIRTALLHPGSLILLLSPTLRQSGELFRAKVLPLWRALGSPLAERPPTQLTLELANGSRLISLPENEEGIRCYSGVTLLVIDEAARVSDALYRAVRPMLAVSQGRLIALSTPFGKRGWYYEAWSGPGKWARFQASARDCPRITTEFLAEERLELGERWFRQEYFLSFEDVIGALFSASTIAAMFDHDDPRPPLFGAGDVPESYLDTDTDMDVDVPALFGSGEF